MRSLEEPLTDSSSRAGLWLLHFLFEEEKARLGKARIMLYRIGTELDGLPAWAFGAFTLHCLMEEVE